MRSRWTSSATLALLVLLPTATLWGVGAEPPPLTLPEAVAEALEHHPRLGVAEAGVRQVEAAVVGAKADRLPRIGFDATVSRTTNPTLVFSQKLGQQAFTASDFALEQLNTPDPLNNFQGWVSIHQPIYQGGAARGRIDAAQASLDAAVSTRERTRQEVVREVIEAYTQAVLIRDQLEVALASLDAARANVALVSDLREAGLVVQSDLLQARVRETEVLELVAQSRGAVEIADARVNLALGRDLDGPLSFPPHLEPAERAQEDLHDLIREALDRRPDLRAGHDRLRSAEKRVHSAKSGYLPQIGVTGLAEANSKALFDSYGTNWSILIGARVPIFDGKRTGSAVRQAAGSAQRAQHELRLLQQTVDLEVRQAFFDLRTASQRLELAAESVKMAEESLRIVRDRYGEGLTTLVELLDSEVSLTRARSRDVAARRDLLLARARLDLAVGRT